MARPWVSRLMIAACLRRYIGTRSDQAVANPVSINIFRASFFSDFRLCGHRCDSIGAFQQRQRTGTSHRCQLYV
jgi:hypothetical protein